MSAFSIADRIEQFLLPFAEKEWIDGPRCQRILGVDKDILHRLGETGMIHLIENSYRSRKKVRYQSVVDFCDLIRREYGFPELPKVVSPYRHRNEDLLPFRLDDTITSAEATEIIGCSFFTLRLLIDEGKVLAYRLVPRGTAPWRISRSSVAEHMRRTLQGVSGGPRAYVQNNVDE